MRSPTCVHCGSPSRPYFRAPRLGTFFRCSQCRWTFQDPDAFESEETWQAAATSQRNDQLFRRVFGETIDTSDAQGDMYPEFGIEQHRLASGVFARIRAAIHGHTDLQSDSAFSVLDIGCATGFLLNEFRHHYQHAQLIGIDPSQVSTAKARELYGLEVYTDTLNSHAFGNRRFDVITIMGNLQLHDNPRATLSQARDLLSADGILIFEMKNPDCLARRLCRLASRFPKFCNLKLTQHAMDRAYSGMRFSASKKDLQAAVTEISLKVLELRTFAPRVISYARRDHQALQSTLGKIWQTLNWYDSALDQRAWIQCCCTHEE